MRAKPMTTPPDRGIAPPLNPVPEPRPTIGIPYFACDLDNLDDIFRGAREKHHCGPRLIDTAVVLIKREVLRTFEITPRAEHRD